MYDANRSLPFGHRHRISRVLGITLLLTVSSVSLAGVTSGEMKTVDRVELERYMGTWYEIARYPNYFQRGIVGVKVEYSLKNDGSITIRNYGRKGKLDGELKTSNATAWLPQKGESARWYVQFIWPLRADYWIIDLADDYRYAVVGQPSRKNLWIISRTPTMTDKDYQEICGRLKSQGYDPQKLRRTPQTQ